MESERASVKEKKIKKDLEEKLLFIPTLITHCFNDCNGVLETGKRETAEP